MPALIAALYGRVSDDSRHRDARSVAEQDRDNEDACTENSWKVGARYADNDLSASRFATQPRPDWLRLLRDLPRSQFGVVVLWEASRGDRTADTWFPFLTSCRLHGILVHVTTHGRTYDVRRPRDWKTLAEEGIASAYASEETSLRVKRALKASAKRGVPHGMAPYGYRRVHDITTGAVRTQVPDEDTAPVAAEIIRRVAEGDSLSAITRDLNDRGIPSPRGKTWAIYPVRNIASNRAYIGRRAYPGEPDLMDGCWDGIVPESVFWEAQAILEARQRGGQRAGRAVHLLSWIAVCGTCGLPLGWRAGVAARHGGQAIYRCHAGHAAMRSDWLDEWVTAQVVSRLSLPDAARRLPRRSGPEREQAAARLAALSQRRRELIEQAADPDSPLGDTSEAIRILDPRIAEARARMDALSLPPALHGLAGHSRAEVSARWAQMKIPARRDVVRALLPRIALEPAGRIGAARFDPSRIRLTWIGEKEPR